MTTDVEKLLEDLQCQNDIFRKQAAEQLGKLASSNPEIVKALLNAARRDTNPDVADVISPWRLFYWE